jgi:hypothetical protein
MKYSDLVKFDSIESVIQLEQADSLAAVIPTKRPNVPTKRPNVISILKSQKALPTVICKHSRSQNQLTH